MCTFMARMHCKFTFYKHALYVTMSMIDGLSHQNDIITNTYIIMHYVIMPLMHSYVAIPIEYLQQADLKTWIFQHSKWNPVFKIYGNKNKNNIKFLRKNNYQRNNTFMNIYKIFILNININKLNSFLNPRNDNLFGKRNRRSQSWIFSCKIKIQRKKNSDYATNNIFHSVTSFLWHFVKWLSVFHRRWI